MSASPATVPARRPPAPAPRRATPAKKPAARPKRRPAQVRPAKRPVRLVRPAPKRRRRRAPFLVMSSLLIGALVVGIVSLQALVSQTSFRMQDLQVRAKALQQHYGEQTLTAARLSAPDRIAAAAHRAGLELPDPHRSTPSMSAGGGHGPTQPSSNASASRAARRPGPP